jgi:hypothetical protein
MSLRPKYFRGLSDIPAELVEPTATAPDTLNRQLRDLRIFGHRPVQLPLRLLHAEGNPAATSCSCSETSS